VSCLPEAHSYGPISLIIVFSLSSVIQSGVSLISSEISASSAVVTGTRGATIRSSANPATTAASSSSRSPQPAITSAITASGADVIGSGGLLAFVVLGAVAGFFAF